MATQAVQEAQLSLRVKTYLQLKRRLRPFLKDMLAALAIWPRLLLEIPLLSEDFGFKELSDITQMLLPLRDLF